MAGGAPTYRTVVLEDESLRSLQGFTQIPNVVLKHTEISFGAKVAYGVLLSYAWAEDFCFPAQERLAKDLNCSVRQVQRLLTELKAEGFITWKQRGLNRPNTYHLLPIKRWNKPGTGGNPDTTHPSPPDTTHPSVQEATDTSSKEDSRKNIHKVVTVVPTNDHRSTGRRSLTSQKGSTISERAIKRTYGLTDDQIGRVHWLVQKQTVTLGSPDRNHAHYVKRAAEAVRDGNDGLLDHLLGEFRQVKREIGIGSLPAYFHAMYTEALEGSRGATRTRTPSTANEAAEPTLVVRERMIADAEQRGVPVPDHIRQADTQAVTQWWADAFDGNRTIEA
jgi:hypothetical protein